MKSNKLKFVLIVIALITMFSGIWGGLLRLGWNLSLTKPELIILHGPLMLCGFIGTLISLERAVASDKQWAFIAPLATALGSILLISGFPQILGQTLILAGSLVLLISFIYFLNLQNSLHTLVMTLGVIFWITGNILWLSGFPVYNSVFWWLGFVLMTITGERLELSRLGNISSKSKSIFLFSGLIILSGLITGLIIPDIGIRILSGGLILFTIWLISYDIARHTIKNKAITRFIASCLLSGYFWLGICGIIGLYSGNNLLNNVLYDSFLHTFFLGFTFSMILGHAPIIAPAILKINLVYSPRFYIPLIFLHFSLLVRISGGLLNNQEIIKSGGLLNVITLVLFILNMLLSVKFSNKKLI